jgi:N-glycosylase/DNA lyase
MNIPATAPLPDATLVGMDVRTFSYNPAEFSLDDTLASGQAFRWKRNPDGWWVGVVGRTVAGIRQDGDIYSWWTYPQPGQEDFVRDYFQLGVDLGEIVRRIAEADPPAGEAAQRWSGLRLVRQDPEECILSFVCSTANSVPRIAYSIGRFSAMLGEPLGMVAGEERFAFPSAGTLAAADADVLTRGTSLGFRGRNIVKVARQIEERGSGWSASLLEMPYEQAHRELVALNGIGAKIADCVCLFSLDKTEAVPVDTHVWQLARDLYFPEWIGPKSITTGAYNTVAGVFRERFGELAGYAQNFLFYDHFSAHWGGKSPLLK